MHADRLEHAEDTEGGARVICEWFDLVRAHPSSRPGGVRPFKSFPVPLRFRSISTHSVALVFTISTQACGVQTINHSCERCNLAHLKSPHSRAFMGSDSGDDSIQPFRPKGAEGPERDRRSPSGPKGPEALRVCWVPFGSRGPSWPMIFGDGPELGH